MRVTESVERMAAEVCLAVLFKGPDIVSSHLAPVLPCADVGGGVVVGAPDLRIGFLPVLLLAKVTHQLLPKAYLTIAPLGLWGVLLPVVECLTHSDETTKKVNVGPLKRQHLTFAHPGVVGNPDGDVKLTTLAVKIKNILNLVRCKNPRRGGRLIKSGKGDVSGRIDC